MPEASRKKTRGWLEFAVKSGYIVQKVSEGALCSSACMV